MEKRDTCNFEKTVVFSLPKDMVFSFAREGGGGYEICIDHVFQGQIFTSYDNDIIVNVKAIKIYVNKTIAKLNICALGFMS